MNENEIEKTALELLGKAGFEAVFGPSIAFDGETPEREGGLCAGHLKNPDRKCY